MNIKYVSSIILVLAASIMLYADEWKEVRNESGILVYTRPVQGSDMDEFKGMGTIDAPIEVVNNALADIPELANWMPECAASYIIEKKSDNHIIFYNEIKTPWPLNNRDVVLETKITMTPAKNPDKIVRTLLAVTHPSTGPKKGKIRMTELSGMWFLQKKGDKTSVYYQIRSNPAGNVSASIANGASKDLPFKSIQGLRNRVKIAKYKTK